MALLPESSPLRHRYGPHLRVPQGPCTEDESEREAPPNGLDVCLSAVPFISVAVGTDVCVDSGITVIVGSTVSLALAFTWGGLRFPWDSANVLAPMIIGAVGIGFFLVAERYWIKGATVSFHCSFVTSEPESSIKLTSLSLQVPSHFFSSPTTLSGYMGTFFHGIISLAAICE